MNTPAKPKPSVPREALARLDDLARKYSLSRASVLREAIDLFEAEYDARDAYKRRGPYIARGDGDSPGDMVTVHDYYPPVETSAGYHLYTLTLSDFRRVSCLPVSMALAIVRALLAVPAVREAGGDLEYWRDYIDRVSSRGELRWGK